MKLSIKKQQEIMREADLKVTGETLIGILNKIEKDSFKSVQALVDCFGKIKCLYRDNSEICFFLTEHEGHPTAFIKIKNKEEFIKKMERA